MHGLRHRLFRSQASRWLAPGLAAIGVLLALSFVIVQGSAARPAQTGEAVTLNFMVTITAGQAPGDAVFWLCPDAQTDGTGCQQMAGQANGPYTYQLPTTRGTTYHHLIIEWTDGRHPSSNGQDPLPQPPVHTVCSYTNFVVDPSEPSSINCPLDFTASTVTVTPSATGSPQVTPTDSPTPTPSSDTGATLITGLQVVIGVGLVLLVILLIILIFQRLGARRR